MQWNIDTNTACKVNLGGLDTICLLEVWGLKTLKLCKMQSSVMILILIKYLRRIKIKLQQYVSERYTQAPPVRWICQYSRPDVAASWLTAQSGVSKAECYGPHCPCVTWSVPDLDKDVMQGLLLRGLIKLSIFRADQPRRSMWSTFVTV